MYIISPHYLHMQCAAQMMRIEMSMFTLAAAVDLQRYHESSTTESMRQRNNNNVGFILLVFLLQKSSI